MHSPAGRGEVVSAAADGWPGDHYLGSNWDLWLSTFFKSSIGTKWEDGRDESNECCGPFLQGISKNFILKDSHSEEFLKGSVTH